MSTVVRLALVATLAALTAMAATASGGQAQATGSPAEFTLDTRLGQLYRESGERDYLGIALINCSFAAMALGNYDAARAMLDEGLPLLREAGDPYWIAMALNFSGDLARCEQKYALAQSAYEESIALLRELGAMRDLASTLHNLGHTCMHLGDLEHAAVERRRP